jgi:hypothetical protein
MSRKLGRDDVAEIVNAAKKHGSATVALRIWTNAESIRIEARWGGRFEVSCRAFSDDPVWNPPATQEEHTMSEEELVDYLLGRTLELEWVQAGGRTVLEGE